MKRLTLTWCHSRIKWGEKSPSSASSFLRELDKNYCQQFTWEELRRAPVSLTEAKSGFDALRALMGR
jgi:hypothetical protein